MNQETKDYRDNQYNVLMNAIRELNPDALTEYQEDEDSRDIKFEKNEERFIIHVFYDDDPQFILCSFNGRKRDVPRNNRKTGEYDNADSLINDIKLRLDVL
jgi:hypothetical protein